MSINMTHRSPPESFYMSSITAASSSAGVPHSRISQGWLSMKNPLNHFSLRHHSFGEDLVLLNQLRDESYQARVNPMSYCGLYMISKPNLLRLLSRYPLLSQQVGSSPSLVRTLFSLLQFQQRRLSLAFRLGVASAIRKVNRIASRADGL